ncbi:MAG: ATP-binding protein [Halanaerobiales bacterium]
MNKTKQLQKKFTQLKKMLLYRDILEEDIISGFIKLFNSNSQQDFYQLRAKLIQIAEKKSFNGELWQSYLLYLLITSSNIFALRSEKYGQEVGENLRQAAEHDLQILLDLFAFTMADIEVALDHKTGLKSLYHSAGNWRQKPVAFSRIERLKQLLNSGDKNVEEFTAALIDYYNNLGAGQLGHFTAFRWQNKDLTGIKNPDPISFDDIIGYNTQKEKLLKNTGRFLRGRTANNVLLFGDSGTGKSSSVKALVNKFYPQGLRLIEINKNQIKELPLILEKLTERGLYFIIFMDDLSFADFETDYKYLKAVMEGGVEVKPKNVLFYATSNRRNLIKESWSERNGESGEIHLTDALEEKHSLVERFGITIHFGAPSRQEYLEIIRGLACKNNLELDEKKLTEKALEWERKHNGRSGRLARQFMQNITE